MSDAISPDSPVAQPPPSVIPLRKGVLRARFNQANLLTAATLCAGAMLIFLPIFLYGFPAGDDASTHYRWATQFKAALDEGVSLYPRWLGAGNGGSGSPAMLYYPPLSLFVTAALDFLIDNTLGALAWSCWLAMLISGATMYVFSRSLMSRRFALLTALLYMTAPYHVFDLYQRSALAEFWSFAWIPLILDAVYRVTSGKGWRAVAYLAVSYGLLLLTHVPLSFALTLLLPVFAWLMTREARRLAQVGAGLLWGAALGAVYLAPVAFERGYVHADRVLRASYLNYFLFNRVGKAFKAPLFPASIDERGAFIVQGTTLVALALPVLVVLSLLVIFVVRRSAGRSIPARRLVIATSSVAILSLLMTTRLSKFIWKAVPPLPYLQFPFRWLAIATVAVFLLAGIALATLFPLNKARAALAVCFLAALGFGLVMSTLAMARGVYDRGLIEADLARDEVSEYHPVWWRKHRLDDFTATAILVSNGEATALDETGQRQRYAINAASQATVKLRPAYFPGWVARVDGRFTPIEPSDDGNIQLTVAPGAHVLELAFEDTPPRLAGKLVSALALLALFVVWFTQIWRARRGEPSPTPAVI
jgi:hypothetical protein